MPLAVEIDEELKKAAAAHSAERMKYEYDRFGLNKYQRESMILIGTIGQMIISKLLNERKVKHEYELQAGEYDNFDFKIGNDIIEIKTSGYDKSYNYLNLLYANDQLDRGLTKKYKYCVQIFINGYDMNTKLLDLSKCDKADIVGYIEFENIKNFKNEKKRSWGDDYKVPLAQLRDINEIFK